MQAVGGRQVPVTLANRVQGQVRPVLPWRERAQQRGSVRMHWGSPRRPRCTSAVRAGVAVLPGLVGLPPTACRTEPGTSETGCSARIRGLGSPHVLTTEERRLVDAATATLRDAHRSADHTVAAAAMDSAGNVFTGVNVAHFTGGPCAEPVAIGRAVATPEAVLPLTCIVAVHDRGVIAPCGRCRQILFDLYPEIRAVVRTKIGHETRPVRELLPYVFDWREIEPDTPQTLHVWEGYLDAIRSGSKTSTVRVDDPATVGTCRLVFDHDSQGTATSQLVEITRVVEGTAGDLTEDDARRDGFADLTELRAALATHYPGIEDRTRVDVVHFRLPTS